MLLILTKKAYVYILLAPFPHFLCSHVDAMHLSCENNVLYCYGGLSHNTLQFHIAFYQALTAVATFTNMV